MRIPNLIPDLVHAVLERRPGALAVAAPNTD